MKWQDRLKNLSLGENMVYGLVWAAIFLIPFMNAHLMSEEINNLDNVIISWGKISPYFLVFLLNNYILAPYLLLRHRYVWYATGSPTSIFAARHRSRSWSGTGICSSA